MGSTCEGAEEIKNHPFFKDMDWSFVYAKAYEPPFKPKFNNNQDLIYFDKVRVFLWGADIAFGKRCSLKNPFRTRTPLWGSIIR